jgi:uroporphyrin-III C-methyltransferase
MTDTDTKSSDSNRRAKAAAPAREGRRTGISAGLALILGILAVAANGYLWYLLMVEHPGMFQTDIAGSIKRLDDQMQETRKNVASVEGDVTELRETQDSIKATLQKLDKDLSRNRTDWMLAEAEQLMVAANNRLHLARDVPAALAALRAADRQLALVANPNLLPVRRVLAQEMNQLEALDKTDVAGIALKLGTLADSVERLPLALEVKGRPAAAPADETPPAAETAHGWRATARSLWHDFKSLVRIRRSSEVERPLLAPEQQYFVRQNLQLMLYSAQQALLQGHAAVYRQDLRTAARWVHEYFDTNTQVVLATESELEKLQGAKIVGELPNISASLDALRQVTGRGAGS